MRSKIQIASPHRPVALSTHFVSFSGLFAAVLLSTACAKPKANVQYVDDPQNRLRIEWEGQPTPNTYTAHVRWPHDPQVQNYEVRRNSGKGMEHLKASGDEVRIVDVASTEKIDAELWAEKDGTWSLLKSVKDDAPTDTVVEGIQSWSSFGQGPNALLHRLFLKSGAVLVSDGLELDLQFDEIYSDGGKISVFPAGQTAAFNQPGRSAAPIRIKARALRGKLEFNLNGEIGGSGHPGLIGRTGEYGKLNPSCYLFKPDGAQGGSGENGGDGSPGGAAAYLVLKIQILVQGSSVSINSQGGAGGAGGTPGAGGPGGPAGWTPELKAQFQQGGTGFIYPLGCVSLPYQGVPGPVGYPGMVGHLGTQGKAAEVQANLPYVVIP